MIREDRAIRSAVHLASEHEIGQPHVTEPGETMTSNRMEAKLIAGEPCRFCGDAKAPLVKTRCCDQWICCDGAFFSFRGGGQCHVEHERFSMCYSHYEDQHAALGKAVRRAVRSGRHEMTKRMRKTRSIGQNIERWWKVNEVQIPGTKNAL